MVLTGKEGCVPGKAANGCLGMEGTIIWNLLRLVTWPTNMKPTWLGPHVLPRGKAMRHAAATAL